jgi:hypothetical protein
MERSFLSTSNQNGIPLRHAIDERLRHYTQKDLHNPLSQFFKEVIIEERFQFWNFLGLAYTFWNGWSKNQLCINFLIASLFSSRLYDLAYFFEKF